MEEKAGARQSLIRGEGCSHGEGKGNRGMEDGGHVCRGCQGERRRKERDEKHGFEKQREKYLQWACTPIINT